MSPNPLSHLALKSANRGQRLLAPLSVAYSLAGWAHRRWFLRPTVGEKSHLAPFIVVGSLRAGGAGKTAVALELARLLSLRGLRVGMVAYRLRGRTASAPGLEPVAPGLWEVRPEADWRHCSDESVLLARESKARVFTTRNREQAWDALSRLGAFDVLVSDDGLMDPRLEGAFRLALRRSGERPGMSDLLPSGPYRLSFDALKTVHCVAEGPLPPALNDPVIPDFGFRRSLVFPSGFDPHRPWWVVTGLGNPEAFRSDLLRENVNVAGLVAGPDHGLPADRKIRRASKLRPEAGFLCTAKDAVKLAGHTLLPNPPAVIRERIEMGPGITAAIDGYLRLPTS